MIVDAFNIEWEGDLSPFDEKEIEVPERVFDKSKTEDEENQKISEYVATCLEASTDFFHKIKTFEWDVCG